MALDASAGVDARTKAGLETGATVVCFFIRICEPKDHGRLFSFPPSGRGYGYGR